MVASARGPLLATRTWYSCSSSIAESKDRFIELSSTMRIFPLAVSLTMSIKLFLFSSRYQKRSGIIYAIKVALIDPESDQNGSSLPSCVVLVREHRLVD